MSRPLTLSLERSVAYVDVLGCYPFDRLLIQAADGGYVYVHRFQIPSADTEAFVRGCEVIWDADKVVFGMPDGEMLTFPAKVITQQTGR